MKTTRTNIYMNNALIGEGDVPVLCPHCGTTIDPKFLSQAHAPFDNDKVGILTYRGNCCKKLSFATYKIDPNKKSYDLISIYPPEKPTVFEDSINNISPRFVKLFNQAHSAELLNHFELAGTGYRNSLEVLIKDYAIDFLNKPEADVKKKSLSKAIQDYSPPTISASADVVRILGNDHTHYERKHDSYGIETIKDYLGIFVQGITIEYKKQNPPVKR